MSRTTTDTPPAAVTPPPLVIAGHGTRVDAGAQDAAVLVEKVRSLLPGVRVEAGFVELTPPTVDEALDTVLRDHPAAVVVPLMIGTGGHVRDDIPEAIDASKARHLDATVVYTRHLGSPKPLLDAVHARIAAAGGAWPAGQTDVVMVGRGCSITDANADHVRLSRVVFETGGYRHVRSAFIQVARPSLPDVLDQYYASGSRRIVVMPRFLFTGRLDQWVHEQVAEFQARHLDAHVRVAEVIGPCDELAQVVAQRYQEGALRARATAGTHTFRVGPGPVPRAGRRGVPVAWDYVKDGAEIYRRSFATIEAEADLDRVPAELRPVAVRMIHASGQIDLLDDLAASPGLVSAAVAALRHGAPILCDSRMVASGIIRSRLPRDNQITCLLGDPRLDGLAAKLGTTKTAAAVELWRPLLAGAVVAIGNAPTALFHLLEVVEKDSSLAPAAVLGLPVGFVGAAESKQALATNSLGLDYLVVHGRRGGSALAVAAVNALCGPDGRTG